MPNDSVRENLNGASNIIVMFAGDRLSGRINRSVLMR